MNTNRTFQLGLALAVLFLGTTAYAADVTKISVFPADIKMNTKLARQEFIVLATRGFWHFALRRYSSASS